MMEFVCLLSARSFPEGKANSTVDSSRASAGPDPGWMPFAEIPQPVSCAAGGHPGAGGVCTLGTAPPCLCGESEPLVPHGSGGRCSCSSAEVVPAGGNQAPHGLRWLHLGPPHSSRGHCSSAWGCWLFPELSSEVVPYIFGVPWSLLAHCWMDGPSLWW